MSAPNIIEIVVAIFLLVGFAITCGKIIQMVNNNKTELKEHKEDSEKALEKQEERQQKALEKHEISFSAKLNDKLESERKRDQEMIDIKSDLKEFVVEQVKHEERINTQKSQIETMKLEFVEVRNEMSTIKQSTSDIKTDIASISSLLKQLVEQNATIIDKLLTNKGEK